MWFWLALIALLCWSGSDLFSKIGCRGNDKYAHLKMVIAVGIIMGSAFTAIVNSLVQDILSPFLGIFTGGINFNDLSVKIGDAEFKYGSFIMAVINFILIALVLFLLIKAMIGIKNASLLKKHEEVKEEAPTTKICPFCKTEIDIEATRCPHCTSVLEDEKSEEKLINDCIESSNK